MRVAVLGAGGLGSVIGGLLADEGVDVTLIGRPAHMEAVRRRGLRIVGVRGDRTVRRNLAVATHPKEADGDFDYLFLTVKAKDTATALEDATELRDRVGVALSLQNSIVKDGVLADWLGRDRVIGAATIEAGTLTEPGVASNHFTVPTTAYFGELDGSRTRRVETLVEVFNAAGLGTKVSDDIVHVEWEKLAQICTASTWFVTTLAACPDVNYRDVLRIPDAAEHFVAVAKEVLSVYTALGYRPQNFFAPLSRLAELDALPFDDAVRMVMEQMGAQAGAPRPASAPSMFVDLTRRRKTEVDVMLGPFVDEARRRRLDVPVLLGTYRVLRSLNTLFD
ncbi:MAG: ketopantoate reductase family protein [Actinomycetota bacterium]|jgi:2-dehydropantoate 2-reductase